MPIGPYANWDACKSAGKSDELCGWLEHHTKEISPVDITKLLGWGMPLDLIQKILAGTFAASQMQEGHYMIRDQDPQNMAHIMRRYEELKAEGIPEPELQRAIMSEFAYGSHWLDPWPPRIEGIDTVDRLYLNLIPASAFPPRLAIQNELAVPDSLGPMDKTSPQWLGMSASTIGGPSMYGEEGAANSRWMPEEAWFPWGIHEALPNLAKFIYNNQENCEICRGFDGMIFDMNSRQRPILPSEGLMFTNVHPNCQCIWGKIDPILQDNVQPSVVPAGRQDHLSHVNRIIGQKSRYGTLHALNSSGSVSDATFDYNPRKLMETIGELKSQFKWLSPEYMQKLNAMKSQGKFLLIRAAAETLTDHRSEGEPYKRLLTGLELYAMARTATGKGMDINHNPIWKTNAVVMDSEGDIQRKEIQMLVYETDPQILQAINSGTITAVSINGGAPRQQDVECDTGECFLVPKGVILGENDGIALTYVVTDPRGFNWRGNRIPPAEPGVKTTKIEML